MLDSSPPVMAPSLAAGLTTRLRALRHVALDLDGTLYRGGTLFPCTVPFLQTLRELGIGFTFLTNNSSRSRVDYLAKLQTMGIPAEERQIMVSTQALVAALRRDQPSVRRVFALGTPSFQEEFKSEGFELTEESPTDEPDAVVVAFDPSMTYARLCRVAWWIRAGKPFFATNPDYTCPTDEPTVLVDCGALCAALHVATGRWPDLVAGKPHRLMLQALLDREDLAPGELAMVGDRLMTDLAMAHAAGTLGIVVLSGEATAADVAAHPAPPELVVSDVGELGRVLAAVRRA